MVPYIRLVDLQDEYVLNHYIYNNPEVNYYFTDDWSAEMYEMLAFAGFISITTKDELKNEYILPEMQFSYAVLTWDNLYISKRIKKLIKRHVLGKNNYSITINKDIDAVFKKLELYHDGKNWLSQKYLRMLKECNNFNNNFNLISVELWDDKTLIAGEIGYSIGSTYTSLTGFFDKENYSDFGKIQLYALALILKESGFKIWNMGHPYMDYKFKMGAKEYQRLDFLNIWKKHRDDKRVILKDSMLKDLKDLL